MLDKRNTLQASGAAARFSPRPSRSARDHLTETAQSTDATRPDPATRLWTRFWSPLLWASSMASSERYGL